MTIPHSDHDHAPVIYFDTAPTFGHQGGVISITLGVHLVRPSKDGNIDHSSVVAAYLRTNITGAITLLDAVNSALETASLAGKRNIKN